MIPVIDPAPAASTPAATVAARLRAIVASHCAAGTEIVDASTWDRLGLDSLDLIWIEIDVEQAFHVPAGRFTDSRGDLPRTFGEFAALLERLTAKAQP